MAINLYPVTKTGDCCADYEVRVNGQPVELNTARVSAVPLNRRWPGHQREREQSELINFLSLSADEPLRFEITPKTPFEQAVIRPRSLGIEPETDKAGTIRFTLDRPACFTVEPYGRNRALHIFCDPVRTYHVRPDNDNILYFGPGEHDVGLIVLKSNQTLFLDEGAVVYACVRAMDAENIRILGRGILDNSRNKAKILFECSMDGNDTAVNNAVREHTVQLEYCTNVEIEGITIRDSLVYNIRPIGCKNLHIHNVKIIGCWRYNSDGIDMHNCEDVLIEHCFLRTFDDSICVKGFDCYYEGDVEEAVRAAMYRNGKAYDVFKNAVIKNCTIWNDWGKSLEIGAETRAEEISGIVFEDCDIIHVTSAPLDCSNTDYAVVRDVVYQNISVEFDPVIPAPRIQQKDGEVYENPNEAYTPRLISVVSTFHHEYSAGGSRRGINRNITFKNIRLYSRQKPRLLFKGYDPAHLTRDILIEDLYWNGKLLQTLDAAQLDENEFTQNIRYRATGYTQLEKNTVAAAHQLEQNEAIRFFNLESRGKRVMFVGNSITLHGKNAGIGWPGEWGMAASAAENDYVHRIMAACSDNGADCAFCICQVAEWERQYRNGKSILPQFESARAFCADIIVMRFVENCPKKDFDPEAFRKEALALLQYLDPSGNAKIILTTGFWHHPADGAIAELAKERNWPLAELGDLGERDEMKATGLFEHTGVANHPGDLGMKHIAERIFNILKTEL